MSDTLSALQGSSLSAEKATFGIPTHTAVGDVTTGANTATFTGAAGFQWFLTHVSVSFGATTTAACTFTIVDGSTTIYTLKLPTLTNPVPIVLDFQQRPLHATSGASLVCSLTSPGAIASAVSATGFKAMIP